MASKPTIIFRADGSASTGLGHLYRSAALAEMLAPEFACYLACVDCPPAARDHFRRVFTGLIELPDLRDQGAGTRVQSLLAEARLDAAIFVLDGYHFPPAYQSELRAAGKCVVFIDDLIAGEQVADLIVNHAGGVRPADYRAPATTRFCLGLRYALLQTHYRAAPLVSPSQIAREERGLICLGGSDPQNDTLGVVRKCLALRPDLRLDVVLGPAYAHAEALGALLADLPPGRVTLHRSLAPAALCSLMQSVDFAVTSPSTVSYEYLRVGKTLYLHQIADNQSGIRRFFLEAGLAFDFGRDYGAVDLERRRQAVEQRAAYFDGKTEWRYLRVFRTLAIQTGALSVRLARGEDLNQFFAWANEPAARANSIHPATIELADHVRWFERRLADPTTLLLIFHWGEIPCAQVRYDLTDDRAVVSISIDVGFRGRALSKPVLALAENQLLEFHAKVPKIVAYVRPENRASERLFLSSGYVPVAGDTVAGVKLKVFERVFTSA